MSGTRGTDTERGARAFDAAIAFITAQPGGSQRLLALHRPDEHHRCRGCATPGTGTPRKRWPRSVAALALASARRENTPTS